MAFEYNIFFDLNENEKKQILKDILILIQSHFFENNVEYKNLSIIIENNDVQSNWKELASIEISKEGFFIVMSLNRDDRNFILEQIELILSTKHIEYEIDEV
ncbi:hypothetical protein O2K51_01905 [Apibacter raozihei]|uniref:hypothetical protein n=1 Tax=Apibacter raozihei TaxID=2500547 RepID=UPI000FE40234|nr:hypothetical protein [Apibacter raozihei]